MKMSALIVVVTLLTATAIAQEKRSRDEVEASAKKVNELRKERIATLREVVEVGFALARDGRSELREVSETRMTLLKAELDAAEKESDHIALYKEALDSLKHYEAIAKTTLEAGRGTNLDRLAVKARRLEVEILLEQAKIKVAK
jgi:outer membrane protein TolC